MANSSPAPHAELVEGVSKMILDHLFAGADDPADLAVRKPFPNQNGNLNFFGGKAPAGSHDCASSLLNIAIASFTRFRLSRMPARRNKQCSQVLLHGAGADVKLTSDFFVAAALNPQVQHLLITRCDFYGLQIDHDASSGLT
jgi:hypothetical protein